MKIEHEMFAHHYILTGDKEAAYKKAYPQASCQALKIAARRLINHPDVRQYISARLETEQQKAVQHYHEEEQRRIEEEQATLLLKRKVLCDMIRGTHKQQRHYKLKDHIETIEDELAPTAVLRAIELDTKLANEWYGSPKQAADEQTVVQKKVTRERLINTDTEEYHELCYGPDFLPGLRARMVRDNPRKAEEYRQQGLRVLDHVPTSADLDRMKEEQQRKLAEWKELKAFAEEQLSELDDLAADKYKHLDTDEDVPPPASAPTLYATTTEPPVEKQNKTIQNDTKQTNAIPSDVDMNNKASPSAA